MLQYCKFDKAAGAQRYKSDENRALEKRKLKICLGCRLGLDTILFTALLSARLELPRQRLHMPVFD